MPLFSSLISQVPQTILLAVFISTHPGGRDALGTC